MKTRLKGVHKVSAKGRVYYYHRPTRTRIKARYGTIDFDREVTALNMRAPTRPAEHPGTLGGLIAAYKVSTEWGLLKRSTQELREWHLKWLKPLDEMPLHILTPPFVFQLRDKMFAAHKRVKANHLLDTISTIWKWGLPRGITKGANPTDGVPNIPRPKNAVARNRRWSQDEIRLFMEKAPSLRVAIMVSAYTALRESDVAALTWSAYDGERIMVQQEKTGDVVWVPAHSDLKAALDALPRTHDQIVPGPRGRPFKDGRQIASLFFATKKRLGLPMDLTFHGLRHTVASNIADEGGDTRDIMAVTGHRKEATVAGYTKQADRQRRAKKAIDLLERM